ncbi:MAG: glycosyl transferase family 2 [Deltaproteobacteria bacterium]|nr:glycosyl transferase family 2 [Deltaproteobacteria bacterium]
METVPSISIVIPVSDPARSLDLLVSRLEEQTVGLTRFECIFVFDTAPGEATRERLACSPLRITVPHPRPLLGISDAMDHGMAAAQGDILVLLADDMVPERDWLAGYARCFAETSFDVVSGGRYRIAGPDDRGDDATTRTPAAQHGLDRLPGAQLGRSPADARLELGLRRLCEQSARSVGCAFAFRRANVAVRRRALKRTSGANPYLSATGDIELGIRLWEVGATFGFAEDAIAVYAEASSVGDPITSYDEALALFWRHPYGLVLLIAAWQRDIERGAATRLSGLDVARLPALHDELDVLAEFQIAFGRAVPGVDWVPRDALVRSLAVSRFVSEAEAREHVDEAIARGVLRRRTGAEVLLDATQVNNWMEDCRQIFQQTHFALGYGPEKRTLFLRTRAPADLVTLRVHGRYKVMVDAEALQGREARINIPVPVLDAHQTDVELTACQPAWLWDHLDPAQGMLLDVPLRASSAEPVAVVYEFTCRVHEAAPVATGGIGDQTPPVPADLEHGFSERHRPRAERILEALGIDRSTDPFDAGRAIYSWVERTVVFHRALDVPLYHERTIETGTGDCWGQVSLFVNLCRLAKVPARVRIGAYFNERKFDPSKHRNVCENVHITSSVYAHSWAEFYVRGRGWISVETQGFGCRRINAINVADERTRVALADEISSYEHDLLGYVSPTRIYTTDAMVRMDTHPLLVGEPDQAAQQKLMRRTVQRMDVTFER